jgi:hypothetical protein
MARAAFAWRPSGTSPFEAVLAGVFEREEVRYAHLRNAEAGCFIARIDPCLTSLPSSRMSSA